MLFYLGVITRRAPHLSGLCLKWGSWCQGNASLHPVLALSSTLELVHATTFWKSEQMVVFPPLFIRCKEAGIVPTQKKD